MLDLSKIKWLLQEQGLTTNDLAKKCNIAPLTIYNMIKRNNTTTDTLVKISEALGVSPSYFEVPPDTSHASEMHECSTDYQCPGEQSGTAEVLRESFQGQKKSRTLEETIQMLRNALDNRDSTIRSLNDKINQLNGELESGKFMIEELQARIGILKEQVNEYKDLTQIYKAKIELLESK